MKLKCFLCDFKCSSVAKWQRHMCSEHSFEAPRLTNLINNGSRHFPSYHQDALLEKVAETNTVNSSAVLKQEEQTAISAHQNSITYTNMKKEKLPGTIDKIDFGEFLSSFPENECVPNILATSVPEPHCSCIHCDKVFVTEKECKVHEAQVHGQTRAKRKRRKKRSSKPGADEGSEAINRECSLCQKTYTESQFKEHMNLHCDICPFVAIGSSHLERHKRSHSGLKLFHCPFCEFRAVAKSSVTLHMRTHTRVRPYPCDQCDYAARTTSQLICHKRTHTGFKPYKCKLCGKNFSQSGSLNRHLKNETCVSISI